MWLIFVHEHVRLSFHHPSDPVFSVDSLFLSPSDTDIWEHCWFWWLWDSLSLLSVECWFWSYDCTKIHFALNLRRNEDAGYLCNCIPCTFVSDISHIQYIWPLSDIGISSVMIRTTAVDRCPESININCFRVIRSVSLAKNLSIFFWLWLLKVKWILYKVEPNYGLLFCDDA